MSSSDTGSYKVAFSPDLSAFTGTGSKISSMVSKGLSSALSSASNGLGSISKGLSSISSSLSNVSYKITQGMVVGIGAAGAAFSAFIPQAIQASDATDQFMNTLKFAGLSTTQIANMTKQAQKYADITVYDLADIQSVSAQLAANGVAGAESVAEAAGNLNAIAGGTKDTYRSVGLVITQTAGLGHLNTQNWLQLSNAIPGASGKLQEALKNAGAYTGNFSDALQNSQISAQEFDDAILKLGSTAQATQAATSTATFSGAWGNLQATIVGGLAKALNNNKAALTGFMNYLNGPAESATNAIGKAITMVSQVLSGQVKISTLVGNAYQSAIGKIASSINTLKNDSSGVLTSIMQQLMAYVHGSISLSDTIKGIGDTLKNAFSMGDVGTIVIGITAAIPILSKITGLASMLTDGLSSVFGIASKIIPLLSPVTVIVGIIAAAMAYFLTQTSQGQSLLTQLIIELQSMWTALQPSLASLMSALGSLWTAIQPLIADVMQIVVALIPALTPILQFLITLLGDIIRGVVSFIQPTIQVIGLITKVGAVLIGWLIPVIKRAFDESTAFYNGIFSIFGSIMSLINDLFHGNFTGVMNNLRNLVGGIESIFNGLVSYATGIGSYIVQGIWSGISSGWGWLMNKLKSFVNSFMKFLRKLFGINSPSKLMASQVGVWLPRGIGVGINNASGDLLSQASELSEGISNAINPSSTIDLTSRMKTGDYSGIRSSGRYNEGIVINQQVAKADSLSEIYQQTKAAANGYFARSIVPPRQVSK